MVTVSTTSDAEARMITERLRTAPAWLDWRVYRLGAQVASSADLRAGSVAEAESQEAR
jgi:hypothetical protein